MIPLLVTAGAVTSVMAMVFALREFGSVAFSRRSAVGAAELSRTDTTEVSALDLLDERLAGTRLGRWLDRELDLAGLHHRPSVVAGAGAAGGVALAWALWNFVAPLLALVGIAAGVLGVRRYLAHAQTRRREEFITQLPELARVLANASHAGLSLPTAVALASEEMPEPSKSELARASQQLNFGAPITAALAELNDRVGSRETNVLLSTLIVAARSGGSLVSSLREIAETLEQRKETRREVRTILSQSIASSNLVIGLGFVMLLIVNMIEPGTVDRMTREPVGQIGLAIASALFVGGFLAIRRMARIEP